MSATGLFRDFYCGPLSAQVTPLVTEQPSGDDRSSVRSDSAQGKYSNVVIQNVFGLLAILKEICRIILNSESSGFPMPESGDLKVLSPVLPRALSAPARRRVQLSLDFSEFSSEDIVSKRCKIETMNISVSSTAFQNNGSSHSFHRTILAKDLAQRLNKSKPLLVLDCRPFFAYNANHIQGAVNINCSDRFNRRRLQQGKCSLVDLVSSKEGKDLYKKRSGKEIIVYDDRTNDIKDIGADATLYLVLAVLRREGKQATILKGGLDGFQAAHEDLCKSCLRSQDHKPLYSPTTPVIEPAIETATATQILSFLYLGNERDAANLGRLKDLGITHVLNVTSHLPQHFESEGITYKRIPASDSGQQNLRQYFEEAGLFIEEGRTAGGKVLVHCQAGVSRSATIVVSYLLQHSRAAMTDAYRYVKSKRSIISPNFNFMGQLLDFEQSLIQGCVQRYLTLEDNIQPGS